MSAPNRRRRQRANGEASRRAILDAAEQIAGERGYDGTSITAVSELSGLPASSIYWHFTDKDALIAAVIDRSFAAWVESITTIPTDLDAGTDPAEVFLAGMGHAAERLTRFPDFLRLGLMLVLERRPSEPAARRRFREARDETLHRIEAHYRAFFTGLSPAQVRQLARLTLAGSDGLFIAAELDDLDLVDEFKRLGHAVLGAARALGWRPPAGR